MVDTDGDIKLSGHYDTTWLYAEGKRRQLVFDFKGEPEWMAPEITAQDIGHDTKADIYSFGMTALELVNGRTPYRDWPPLKILLNKLHKKYPPLQDCRKGFSKAFYQMVAACLAKNPAKRLQISPSPFQVSLFANIPSFDHHRPTAQQLLAHNFFRLAKDKSYLATNLVGRGQQIRQEMIRNGTLPGLQDGEGDEDGEGGPHFPYYDENDGGREKWDL